MNKSISIALRQKAEEVALRFSKKNREGNFNEEVFSVNEIIPLSDVSACVFMEKNTGKKAAFFFYYIGRGASKGWHYFVPTDAHILGMQSFGYYKLELERNNYKYNFEDAIT
jgi:hypothetical protein